ncbi:MAG: polysaccharide pyruvyl transferase family protein [Elusimicrobiota bacterium]
MYTLLSVVRTNVGDFLYHQRIKELLDYFKPGEKHLELSLDKGVDYQKPLDDYLDKINTTRAILICGGPLYFPDLFPARIPVVTNFKKLKVPVIPFGWGLGGTMDCYKNFKFTIESALFLNFIHNNCRFSSVRDILTQKVLNEYGYENVIMTGDPAWYNLKYFGLKFNLPDKCGVKKIVFTTAQNLVHDTRLYLLNKEMIKTLRKLFPEQEIYLSVHKGRIVETDALYYVRGIVKLKDKIGKESMKKIMSKIKNSLKQSLPWSKNRRLNELIKIAKNLGYKTTEATGDLSKIAFYDTCDLHIGFRLHAHLYFLSIKKPSYLIYEDVRGQGFANTINSDRELPYNSPDVIETTIRNFQDDFNNGFQQYKEIFTKLEGNFKEMEKFVKSLP